MQRFIILLAILVVIASVATVSLADPNLIVWYEFEDTYGHTVTDSSGNGYNGQIKGSDFAHPSYPRTDPTWNYLFHPDDWSDTQPERFHGWQADGAIGGCLSNNYFNRCMYVDVPTAALASFDRQGTFAWWSERPNTSLFGVAHGAFFRSSPMSGTTAPYVTITGYPTRGETSLTYNIGDLDGRFWGGYSAVTVGSSWNHFTLVFDADAGYETLYLNGAAVQTYNNTSGIAGMQWLHLFSGVNALNPTATWDTVNFFHGRMDDFRMYNAALSAADISLLVGDRFKKAYMPTPADNATQVSIDNTVLRWYAGQDAVSHHIYLGQNLNEVENADITSPCYKGEQTATTFDTNTLEPMMTYYWRVDEVDSTNALWKGDVWSFEVAPTPKIDDPIVWYTFEEGTGSVTADISGNSYDANLFAADRWNAEGFDGSGCLSNAVDWGSFYGQVPPVAFANIDTAISISLWFYNEGISELYGYGGFFRGSSTRGPILSMDVYDATVWDNSQPWNEEGYLNNYMNSDHYIVFNTGATSTGGVTTEWWYGYKNYSKHNFEQWHNITMVKDCETLVHKIYYDGLEVQNVNCNANQTMDGINAFRFFSRSTTSNEWWDPFHGRMDDFRIYDRALTADDVKLFVGDRFRPAWGPYPSNGAKDLPLDALTINWRPGQGAVSHQVYFGENYSVIKNADTSSSCYKGEQTGTSFNIEPLEMMRTYYWRVDEIDNKGNLWKGEVWSFSSLPYLIVEDFESYDDEGNDVTAVWVDALDYSDMQRLLATEPGYPVLSPVNSLRLRYHALEWSPASYYTIAGRTFSPAQDWTANGVKILSIHYYGDAGNQGLPMFVTIGDGTTDANVVVDVNTLAESWNQINVSLPEIAAAGVDLTKVSYMEIGFGDGTDQGMSSGQYDIIYIDDIALYPPKCVLSESSLTADITQDCVVDYDDFAYITDGWLSDAPEANLDDNETVDFKDYSILAKEWLTEDLWP